MLRHTEKFAGRPVDHFGPAQLAIQAVAGNVRRAQRDLLQQGQVDGGLAFPDIQHHAEIIALRQYLVQRGIVCHGTACGVDEHRALPELAECGFIEQVTGRVIAGACQRHVHGHHVRPQRRLQIDEIIIDAGCLQRRIVHQAAHAQRRQALAHAGTDIAATDDARGLPGRLETLLLREHQQAADHVLGCGGGVAAGRRGKADAAGFQVSGIDVIEADGGGTHEAHRRPGEQGLIHPAHRTHQQDIRSADLLRTEAAAVYQRHLAQRGKGLAHAGNVFIGNDFHELSRAKA